MAYGNVAVRIAVVGAGWSATSLLCRLAERWSATPPGRLGITVIDAGGEQGGGGPYGRTVDPAYLLNDAAAKVDQVNPGFLEWLGRARASWYAELVDMSTDAPLVRRWLVQNAQHLDEGAWGRLYVPRRVFGTFARERYAGAVRRLRELGVHVTELTAEVAAIRPNENATFRLVLGARCEIQADHVVLAIGRSLSDGRRNLALPRTTLAGLRTTPAAIEASLSAAAADRPDLVILGSSISACEVIYCVAAADVGERWSVTVVGGNGRLPTYPRDNLAASRVTLGGDLPDADRLAEAVMRCFAEAEGLGYGGSDVHRALKPQVSAALARLPGLEQSRYQRVHEARVRRRSRQTSPEYAEAADRLAARGALRTLTGYAVAARPSGEGCTIGVDTEGGLLWIKADQVIDCRGFGPVSDTANPLVRQLTRDGIAVPTSTGTGLRVDRQLRIKPGLHLLGPLLDGNDAPGSAAGSAVPIGHVENLERLRELGSWIADDIVRTVGAYAANERPTR